MRRDKGELRWIRTVRAAGCSAYPVGPPLEFDVLVGANDVTYLVELKNRERVEAKNLNLAQRVRRERQAEWRAKWKGGPVMEAWDDDPIGFLTAIGVLAVGVTPKEGPQSMIHLTASQFASYVAESPEFQAAREKAARDHLVMGRVVGDAFAPSVVAARRSARRSVPE
jgi:hypothetical protein